MATQALYRRYRPRRFSEVRGQEHVVRALRNAIINHREGQAYLFSGPRGTGKTTSARILAKVLNCERPVDGEPCCECDSCLAVERGTSYDVHELDAASNNGVDAMRDLIEKASLGTPGRHKVYILDEVHMLSKQAEAALLKTLEEPPAHVVFVLATTDPQKVSETIRSRTQHLRFHLLPMEELEQHVRWVAEDAGLQVSEAAIQSVLAQGGGSARDTLSALELVASAGGDQVDTVQYDEFVEALIEMDPGRALAAAAFAVQQGRDSRGLTEDIVRHLRDCFLSLMAPELVALPDAKAAVVADQASRLGAARTVRAMERLGEMLVEMRHAPDPRLLLEVALVQLTNEGAASDLHTLMSRLERLEQAVANGLPGGAAAAAPGASGGGSPGGAGAPASKVDPATGRVPLGGGARRDAGPRSVGSVAATMGRPDGADPAAARTAASADPARPAPAPTSAPAPADGDPADHAGAVVEATVVEATVVEATVVEATVVDATVAAPGKSLAPSPAAPSRAEPTTGASSGASAPVSSGPSTPPTGAPAGGQSTGDDAARAVAAWPSALATLKPFARALFTPASSQARDGQLVLGLPNEAHRRKCVDHLRDVEAALVTAVGAKVPVTLVVDGSAGADHDDAGGAPPGSSSGLTRGVDARAGDAGVAGRGGSGGRTGSTRLGDDVAPVVELRPGGAPTPDEDIDLDDLVDAPPESVVTPFERLAQAFPGSELIDERH